MLSMSAENFLDRRLQTIVWRLGLAKSVHHARVLIKQGHIRVGKQIVNVPSFLVRKDSERHIDFALNSPFGGGRPGRNKRKALASKVSPNPCPLLRASGRPGRPRERTTPPEPAPGAEDGRGCGRHGGRAGAVRGEDLPRAVRLRRLDSRSVTALLAPPSLPFFLLLALAPPGDDGTCSCSACGLTCHPPLVLLCAGWQRRRRVSVRPRGWFSPAPGG